MRTALLAFAFLLAAAPRAAAAEDARPAPDEGRTERRPAPSPEDEEVIRNLELLEKLELLERLELFDAAGDPDGPDRTRAAPPRP